MSNFLLKSESVMELFGINKKQLLEFEKKKILVKESLGYEPKQSIKKYIEFLNENTTITGISLLLGLQERRVRELTANKTFQKTEGFYNIAETLKNYIEYKMATTMGVTDIDKQIKQIKLEELESKLIPKLMVNDYFEKVFIEIKQKIFNSDIERETLEIIRNIFNEVGDIDIK